MTFFVVEKFVRIVRGNDSSGHGHSHHHARQEVRDKKAKQSDDEKEEGQSKELTSKKKEAKYKQVKDQQQGGDPGRIRVAAYLNLVADFMHNFTDGLAIGASFIAGSTVGVGRFITFKCKAFAIPWA